MYVFIFTCQSVYAMVEEMSKLSGEGSSNWELSRLCRLCDALCEVVASEEVTLDAAPLFASSIVTLISLIQHQNQPPNSLAIHVLKKIAGHEINMEELFSTSDSTATGEINMTLQTVYESSSKRYSILAFIHSLLKVLPSWLPLAPSSTCEDFSILTLYLMIESYCQKVSSPSCYQAFFIMQLWTEVVKVKFYEMDINNFTGENSFILQMFLDIFSLQQQKPGMTLKFLSMHWETPVKGT